MEELANMLQRTVRIEETPCDVYIVSGGKTGQKVEAHQNVLSECGWYFKTIFEKANEDKEEGGYGPIVIFVPNVSNDCMKSIVKFCYTKNFEDTDVNVLELLSGAAFLQIRDLVAQCEQYILACLDSCNWILIWRFVRDHFMDLSESVIQFVRDNFNELVVESEIYELNLDELVNIVNVEDLSVRQKKICSEAFFRWLQHEPERRLLYTPSVG